MFTKRVTAKKFSEGKKILLSRGGRVDETNKFHGTITFPTVMGNIVVDYEFRAGVATFYIVKLPFCLTEKQVWRFIEEALM